MQLLTDIGRAAERIERRAESVAAAPSRPVPPPSPGKSVPSVRPQRAEPKQQEGSPSSARKLPRIPPGSEDTGRGERQCPVQLLRSTLGTGSVAPGKRRHPKDTAGRERSSPPRSQHKQGGSEPLPEPNLSPAEGTKQTKAKPLPRKKAACSQAAARGPARTRCRGEEKESEGAARGSPVTWGSRRVGGGCHDVLGGRQGGGRASGAAARGWPCLELLQPAGRAPAGGRFRASGWDPRRGGQSRRGPQP